MKTVVTQFLEQAAKHPGNAAVLDIRGTYTYERMNNRSAYLAEQILEKIGGKGKRGRIALFLPRTKEFVVSLFAVLRAGCAAVPIDGEYPRERVRTILEDVGCALCITTAEKAAGRNGWILNQRSMRSKPLRKCAGSLRRRQARQRDIGSYRTSVYLRDTEWCPEASVL